jgi:hypothetical protein
MNLNIKSFWQHRHMTSALESLYQHYYIKKTHSPLTSTTRGSGLPPVAIRLRWWSAEKARNRGLRSSTRRRRACRLCVGTWLPAGAAHLPSPLGLETSRAWLGLTRLSAVASQARLGSVPRSCCEPNLEARLGNGSRGGSSQLARLTLNHV